MLPPGPASTPLNTRQLSACCLRLASVLLFSASLTRAITASKSAALAGRMTLNIIPASDVNLREAGTAGAGAPAAAGVWAAGGVAVGGACCGEGAPAGEAAASAIMRTADLTNTRAGFLRSAEGRQTELAEPCGERARIALPHTLGRRVPLFIGAHRPEQHVEELVLRVRRGRLEKHDVEGVGAERLGRLVDLEARRLLLEGLVRRLREAGFQLADHLFEVRGLVRLDLHEQDAGRGGKRHLRRLGRGRGCRRLLSARRRLLSARGRLLRGGLLRLRRRGLGKRRSGQQGHRQRETRNYGSTHSQTPPWANDEDRHSIMAADCADDADGSRHHTKTAMTSFAMSMPSRVSRRRGPSRTSQPASRNGWRAEPYRSHTSIP